jgi:hypothetical protein
VSESNKAISKRTHQDVADDLSLDTGNTFTRMFVAALYWRERAEHWRAISEEWESRAHCAAQDAEKAERQLHGS